jgi:putative tricarboxylic transport membrane protein
MKILQTIVAAFLLLAGQVHAAECIVPSKPGGAMDLTCKLAQKGLATMPGAQPMRLVYRPGGIGAVAWHSLASQRRAEPNTLVAFSGGSLLNIAQGKFGKASADDVRWVAALGVDYGMIAVRSDSPFKSLADLVAALKRDPSKVLVGVSGTIGSQDWLKVAMLVRQAGMDPKVLRFVALEGGGEAFTAMQANYVHVVSGDASEASLAAAGGKIRVLAVMSEQRLPGVFRHDGQRADRARAGLRPGLAGDPRRVDGATGGRCRLPAMGGDFRQTPGQSRVREIAHRGRAISIQPDRTGTHRPCPPSRGRLPNTRQPARPGALKHPS